MDIAELEIRTSMYIGDLVVLRVSDQIELREKNFRVEIDTFIIA